MQRRRHARSSSSAPLLFIRCESPATLTWLPAAHWDNGVRACLLARVRCKVSKKRRRLRKRQPQIRDHSPFAG
jgi:hypothetical protein